MSNEYKDWLSDKMYEDALLFASMSHNGQIRKFTGEPYIEHPKLVSRIIHDYMESCDDIPLFAFDPMDYSVVTCAALLHDIVEDTNVTYDTIEKMFGKSVRDLVYWLTDELTPEDGNRKYRKEKYLQKILDAPYDAKCLKIADVLANIKNLRDIGKNYDNSFVIMYLNEKQELLNKLKDFKERKKRDKRYYWYKIFSKMLHDLEIELNEINKNWSNNENN